MGTVLVIVLVVAAVVVVVGGVAWWARRRWPREVRLNDDYNRASGQAYLQAQHTRNDIGNPFQG